MKLAVWLDEKEIAAIKKLIQLKHLPLDYVQGPDYNFNSDYFIRLDTGEKVTLRKGFAYIREQLFEQWLGSDQFSPYEGLSDDERRLVAVVHSFVLSRESEIA